MHIDLEQLEQYNQNQIVIKGLFKGKHCEAVLLSLVPGQEMPTHAHEAFEVALLPRTGTATMTVSGKKDVVLKPGTLYFESAGNTFRIVNTGDEPFQVLIYLSRVS